MSEKAATLRLCFKRLDNDYQVQGIGGVADTVAAAKEIISLLSPDGSRKTANYLAALGSPGRLEIDLEDAEELDDLPWELLTNQNQTSGVSLLRSVPAPNLPPDLALVAPLRVLAVIARPSDLPPFDVSREWEFLEEVMKPLVASGQISIERLEAANEACLQALLARKRLHVLHFIGYGRSNLRARSGSLLLETQGGASRAMPGQYLGSLLREHADLRLVVLDLGSKVEDLSPFAVTARALVRNGVGSVVAMRRRFSAQASMGFFRELYRSLASGFSVDYSVMTSRSTLFKVPQEVEWDIPMLYSAGWDRVLLNIEGADNDSQVTRDLAQEQNPGPVISGLSSQDSPAGSPASDLDEPEQGVEIRVTPKTGDQGWRSRKTVKILILAASPDNVALLRVNEELREIDAGLRWAKYRQRFKLEQRMAVRPLDLQQALLDVDPQIVHFCGHGGGPEGLIFEDNSGHSLPVSGAALGNLFKLFSGRLECVVLNSCHSEDQAKVISQYIPYVIGMKRGISDRAAIDFSIGFYRALGAGQSVEFAFQVGRSAIELESLPDYLTPILLVGQRSPAEPKPSGSSQPSKGDQ